jgi:hypothetical protein
MLSSTFPVLVFNSNGSKFSGIGVDYSAAASGMRFWVNGSSSDISGTGTFALSINTGNFVTAVGSFRAPIFYDSDNTTYYIDPAASTSLNIAGGITIAAANPYISASSYIVMPGGAYFSSGTVYCEAAIQARGGISNDSGNLTLNGGTGGYTNINGSARSPIFYDSNDTTYYVDPNSTSYQRSLFLGAHDSGTSEFRFGEDSSGWYGDRWYWDSAYTLYRYSRYAGTDSLIHYHDTRDGSRITYGRNIVFDSCGKGIVVAYDAAKVQLVFAMGDSYKPSAAGDATNNMYGMGWSHPNAGGLGGASNLNDHGLLIINNGTFRAAISSRIVASEEVRGTLFRDYNDTGYYCDPNSSGVSLRIGGAIQSNHVAWTGEANKIQWHANNLYIQNVNDGYLIALRRSDGSNMFYCDAGGNVTAAGNITAYSDIRLKENVKTISNALSLVQRLRGVTFDWIETKKHSYGVIAQEVEEVIPELVHESDDGAIEGSDKKIIKSVDYSKIVSVLIEAIKEQQQQIEKQQKQIEELRSLIN